MNSRLKQALAFAHNLQPSLHASVRVPGGLGATTPSRMNAGDALEALDKGFDKRVNDIKPGAQVGIQFHSAQPASIQDALQSPMKYASSTDVNINPSEVNYNPNSDRSYLAHEMGHIASQQTDVGHFVNTLRTNPKLTKVLLGATAAVPFVASAFEAGDDDLDTSIMAALAASSPTIVDEALASKNALAIMDNAGMRATLGQRGRLAGALMSYTAGPILAAVAANKLGNVIDQNE